MIQIAGIAVHKKQLANGLTILVVPIHRMPKVAVQLWYNVGSRHEQSGQKGLAHLIEHMIFKGTTKLTESDINIATAKLSGSCNAFTSHDYTGYLFDFPTQHWSYALEILAECMRNCAFKPDLLNSELKAVVQELKMYKDDYASSVADELISVIFGGHPYHYPIIGYKNDLYTVTAQNLHDFYSHHYVPNNATLVVVGDVNEQEVYDQAQRYFGAIQPEKIEKSEPVYFERDFSTKTVTLYRDIQAPVVLCAFVIPGFRDKCNYALDALNLIIGSGRGSRLYKTLVEQLKIATTVESFNFDLFDYGLLLIQVQPKSLHNIAEVVQQIKEEISDLVEHGIKPAELERAQAKEDVYYLSLFEDNQKLAATIGKSYVATGDEQYVLNYCNVSSEKLCEQINTILGQWFNPELMHVGYVLPLAEKDKKQWLTFQQQSDEFDAKLLVGKERTTTLEEANYANNVIVREFQPFEFPRYQSFMFSNGLEVLYYRDNRLPKVEMILSLKADYLYDPSDKSGLSNFASQLLLKGTSKYSATELMDILEIKGISIGSSSGFVAMNCLSRDLSFACDMMEHILTDSLFAEESVEQVRHKIEMDLAEYWDEPYQFVGDLVRKQVYQSHPYSKNLFGTKESVRFITQADLVGYYKKYITPQGTRLVIIGDFDESNLKNLLENTLGKWMGPVVSDINYPSLQELATHEIIHTINRDQVTLCFAGLSVDRKNPDYDKLLLFDQSFGGGVLGSMNSQLFKIREQTGLFYTIGGSLLVGVDKQPGIAMVKTIISLDHLAKAEHMIKQVIETAAENFGADDLAQAQRAISSALVDYFASYRQMAMTFLALRRFDLPIDYFDHRAQQLACVDLPSIKQVAARILDLNKLVTIKIGRL